MSVDLGSGAASGVITPVGSDRHVDRHGDNNPLLPLSLACESLYTGIIDVNS